MITVEGMADIEEVEGSEMEIHRGDAADGLKGLLTGKPKPLKYPWKVMVSPRKRGLIEQRR